MFVNVTSHSFSQHLWKDYFAPLGDKQVRRDSGSEETNPTERHNR